VVKIKTVFFTIEGRAIAPVVFHSR